MRKKKEREIIQVVVSQIYPVPPGLSTIRNAITVWQLMSCPSFLSLIHCILTIPVASSYMQLESSGISSGEKDEERM